MRIHLIQLNTKWEQKEANFASVRSHFEEANPSPGSLVVLPEMFATGFNMAADQIAEPSDSKDAPTRAFLSELASRWDCAVIAGIASRDAQGASNDALAVFPDGSATSYEKHQPFTLAGEDRAYRAGDELCTFSYAGGRHGLSICYDLRFPEIYRALAKAGAELLVNIANWPLRRVSHWVTLLQARAIENQCYVAGVNRAGSDPNHDYGGRSLIVDPQGEIIADAGSAEGIVSADIDFESVRAWRAEFPALADARDDTPTVSHFELPPDS